MRGSPAPSPEEVLNHLDFLAAVEHSLCVEFLVIHCALGHELPAVGASDAVVAAAGMARNIAMNEMFHLHDVNQELVAAGRDPQVGRAESIRRASGEEIAFGLTGLGDLERFLDREHELASAVDARYAWLGREVDHSSRVDELERELEGLGPGEFLRVTRRDPADEVERSLLDLGDRFYGVLVDLLETGFGDEALFSRIRRHAVAVMNGVDAIDTVLVERRLLPRFTAQTPVADPLPGTPTPPPA